MTITNEDSELVDLIIEFGEIMLGVGAEIGRVEDSLARMGRAYGAVKTNVFVITSSIELTMQFSDGQTVTRTRRITGAGDTDFVKLRELNALSRRCCTGRVSLEELRTSLDEINSKKMSTFWFCVGSVFASGGFSLFFGGSLLDALLAGLFSLLICWMQFKVAPLMPNKIFFLFVCSFITGVGICLIDKVIPGLNIDKVIIGDIMLLIPGIAITTAVRDTLIGDTISGVIKLADSLVWAGGLAAGFMTAISLLVR